MKKKKFWFLSQLQWALSIAVLLALCYLAREHVSQNRLAAFPYPNFQNNPHLDQKMRTLMAPYLLPLDHPIKATLDSIFSQSRVTQDKQTLIDAGFSVIASMPGSFVVVARHPAVPGYVFKLYLDSETRCKQGIPNWEWLTRRCIGAEKIRKLIHKKKLRYFTIPDKWLYPLPLNFSSQGSQAQPVVVVETDMELESEQATELAWKTHITPKHLDELYAILRNGYGTIRLAPNIPYTKNGTFAFTDTEYPERRFKLKRAKLYLSEEMQLYWDQLIY
jgi:hypothetical protein